MTEEISYTPEEVAGLLKISRYTVYELIKRGELKAYRIGRKVRVESGDLDAYKQGFKTKGPEKPQLTASPIPLQPATGGLIICGQDIVLDILARYLERQATGRVLRNQMSSIDGLMALYKGIANVVGAHLWDGDSGEYNLPYIRRLLPGHRITVINLLYRQIGFCVAAGNPQNITGWEDLAKSEIRLVNREPGSGARVLLDEQLRLHNIEHNQVLGYRQEESSHLGVASRVARGDADVGVGIEKAAMQVKGVEFIPLQKERFDLVVRKQDLEQPYFQTLLTVLRSESFSQEVAGLGGYDISRIGEIIAEM